MTISPKPLARLLSPRSVAIVGASSTPGSLGLSVLRNLQTADFSGTIHLINPKRTEIEGLACLPSADDLPAGVDCAVLAIPRAGVLPALESCVRRGVGAAILFSAGFAEAGPAGLADQERIRILARDAGMIVEGPNCLGMVNFVDRVPLTFIATPQEAYAPAPRVAILSQSGAMAAVLAVSLRHKALGLSYSISTGNEAVTGIEDFLDHLADDPHTKVFAMVVEQFRAPQRFLELAARVRSAGKYIVLLHPGSSLAARASAQTHTGAMAGNFEVMRMKVQQAGVFLVETAEELADLTDLLVRAPAFTGGGAAVFTESGAFKALTLDFCERLSLPLPALSPATASALRAVLPEFIPPTNPLDITAQGLVDPEIYRRALPPVLLEPLYGSVVLSIILTDEATSALKLPPILVALREIEPTKPILFAAMDEGAGINPDFIDQLRALGVPFLPTPERAFRALARLHTAFESFTPASALDHLPGAATELPTGTIPEYRSKQILGAAGIPVPVGSLATTLEEARLIAARIGYPVVLKAQHATLTHKSDVGGVALNLPDKATLGNAWQQMHKDVATALPGLQLEGILVEGMGAPGVELIVGAQNDPDWGPVLLIGFGGVLAEVLNDVRLIAPEASEPTIIAELLKLKSAALLSGFRGSAAPDLAAAAQAISRLGTWMLTHPIVREVDINPLVVYPQGQGVVALDALIVCDAHRDETYL